MEPKTGKSSRAIGAGSALALLATLVAVAVSSCRNDAAAPVRPNVIVWLADTLRADHLGCYGYDRPTTPNMDFLASSGVLIEDAHVHANWTQPSVTSILSGVYPLLFDPNHSDRIPPGMIVLPEWFRRHGYAAYGITLNAATASIYGYGDGFDVYQEMFQRDRPGETEPGVAPNAKEMVDEAIRLIEEHQAGEDEERPFFLYLQSMDPHEPYTTHPGYADFTGRYRGSVDGSVDGLAAIRSGKLQTSLADRQHLIDLYDGEVAFNDDQLGRFSIRLEQLGLAENTLTVVLSDHGEEMFERDDQGHSHRNLHAELTHIPLLFYWPGTLPAGLRIPGVVGAIDIAPTLVELAGLPPLPDPDGRSLGPAIRRGMDPADLRPAAPRVFIHHSVKEKDLMAVRTDEFLFLLDQAVVDDGWNARRFGASRTALYDLIDDPGELRDIAAERPDVVEELTRAAEAWLGYRASRVEQLGERSKVRIGVDMREALEQLGYLR